MIPAVVALFVGAGFVGTVPAADLAACKKQADELKITGDAAKKFIDECVKGGKK